MDTDDQKHPSIDDKFVANNKLGVSLTHRQVNRLLALSLLSLALISLDQNTDLLLLYVALPILVYVFFIMSTKYVRTVMKNKKNIPLALLDILGNGGPLLTGNFFASAFLSSSYYAAQKLMLWTEDHSRKGLVSVFGKQPKFVLVIQDGKETKIPFENVLAGQKVVVHAGNMIPVDGTIIDGVARIDERSLTGEFQPAEKGPDDQTFAGTILLSGTLVITVEKAGAASLAAQIAKTLNATSDYKSGLQTRGEMIMNRGAIPTLALSALALALSGVQGALGIKRIIISGDRTAPTKQLAEDLKFEKFYAETLPEDKAQLIKDLQAEERSVCYIGDGINDSIALKQANVSISLSGASAIATDVAGVILMDGTLKKVSNLLDTSRSLDRSIRTTTILSFIPGIICVLGVFFYNINLVTAILIYNVGLTVSMCNALMPWVVSRWQRALSRKSPSATS